MVSMPEQRVQQLPVPELRLMVYCRTTAELAILVWFSSPEFLGWERMHVVTRTSASHK